MTVMARPMMQALTVTALLTALSSGNCRSQVPEEPKDLSKVREAYQLGFRLLESGKPRQQVIDAWKECLGHDPEIGMPFGMPSLRPVFDFTTKLRKMLKEEARLALTEVTD